jgi:hypothetical protein
MRNRDLERRLQRLESANGNNQTRFEYLTYTDLSELEVIQVGATHTFEGFPVHVIGWRFDPDGSKSPIFLRKQLTREEWLAKYNPQYLGPF